MTGDLVQAPAGPTDRGVSCFHTYWNVHEVPQPADAFSFSSENVVVGTHDNLGANCRHITATTSGPASVTATVAGVTTRVDLVIPQS